LARLQPTDQAGARRLPVALDGNDRHLENFGDLILAQSAEESQLDDARGTRVVFLELGERLVEEWFDANRLRLDYVPKGFHLGSGPIVWHEYGQRLSVEEKRVLIAFLKTL
jgi:hypothetical protein